MATKNKTAAMKSKEAEEAMGEGEGEAEEESVEAEAEEGNGIPEAPSGFRQRSAVTDAPWFTLEVGNVCHGKLIGRYEMQMDPPRAYYQVELYRPCIVTVGRGDDAEQTEAKKGTVINVGETFKLESLKEIEIPELLAGGEYDVWIPVEKKLKLQGGKTMWVINLKTKRTKAPTTQVRPLMTASSSGGQAEDNPF